MEENKAKAHTEHEVKPDKWDVAFTYLLPALLVVGYIVTVISWLKEAK